MPSPYLLLVNSRPCAVDDELWMKWYTTEHVPDLVNHGASTYAAFYREHTASAILESGSTSEGLKRPYLALYQSDYEEPLESPGYVDKVRQWSDLFPKLDDASALAEFNGRNYCLEAQDFRSTEEQGLYNFSNFIVTEEFDSGNDAGFEQWYENEHTGKWKTLGCEASLRYVSGPQAAITTSPPSRHLAIHGFSVEPDQDKLVDLVSDESKSEFYKNSSVRVWKIVQVEGKPQA